MALQDAKINEMTKELQILEKKLDKEPNNEDLKRERKNLKERIRVRTQKLLEGVVVAEEPAPKPIKEKKESLGFNVAYEMARGNDSAVQIAMKYGAKLASVRWYISKSKKSGLKTEKAN